MNLVAENLFYKPDEQFHLNDVSFNFKKGNIYTILGRTLSGKTTLLKTVAGLLTPDTGTIQFEEKDFLKVPVWERNIAMVYQQFINYPHLNVFENVAFPLKQRKVEGHNFDIRKNLLDYDDVSNDQRQVIYQQRLELMSSNDISETIEGMREEVLFDLFHGFIPPDSVCFRPKIMIP